MLSREGREEAAERWHEGEFGPHSPMAQAAPARCSGCGFLAPLAGMLGQGFGVCTNEISPSDGRVVSLDFGCGAHSEAAVVPATHPTSEPVVDEYVYDTVTFGERVVLPEGEASQAAEAAAAAVDGSRRVPVRRRGRRRSPPRRSLTPCRGRARRNGISRRRRRRRCGSSSGRARR